MFNSGSSYSLSDIATATGNRDGGGWGSEGGAWWIIILFLFVFCGWGGNGGWGGNNNAAMQGALTRADLCSEFNFDGLENSVRGIQQGLCDGFYAQNTGMLNGFSTTQMAIEQGFAGVNNALCSLGFNIQNGINDVNVNQMQNTNALQRQISDCCCENRAAIAQVRYDMATDTCALTNAINQGVNSINQNIDNQFCQLRMEQKDQRIKELETINSTLRLADSQSNQNAYFNNLIQGAVQQLQPTPKPCFLVANPNGCGCGNNFPFNLTNGCGNGCNFC